ncbi:hypothetical protein HY733_03140 [Candidatus Uhrbacteria bacterium]|nr:hypothetical protein [Candidatus Uhrbacteria bacterium]
MAIVLYTLLLFVGLIVTEEIFHRYPRFSLAFFSIVSAVLFSCWILLFDAVDWFPWAKVFSIASGIAVLSIFRTTRLGKDTKLVQWVTYAFLAVNILEAVVRDASSGGIGNYLNAVAGFLLIATLEKLRTVHIDRIGKFKDLYWSGMTLPWIIGYTLWNWAFVYLNFGFQSSVAHIAVLGSALVIGFVNKDRWLQARVFTLGMFFVLFHSFPHLNTSPVTDIPSEQLGLFVSLVPFGFMITYAIICLRRIRVFPARL